MDTPRKEALHPSKDEVLMRNPRTGELIRSSETFSPTEEITEGNWVEILDHQIAKRFAGSRAKVVLILEGENRSVAFLYGKRREQAGWIETPKGVPLDVLQKIDPPEEAAEIIRTSKPKKKSVQKSHSQKNGNGGYAREAQRFHSPQGKQKHRYEQ